MNYEQCKTEFIKTIGSIDYSLSRYDVVKDFAELTRITILNQLTPFYSDDAENRYLEIVKNYKKDDLNKIAHLFALVQIALDDSKGDFLGECLMSLDMGSKHIGQFFTPYHLCRLNAEIILNDISESIKRKGYFDISEPAAGGGGMIIAAKELADFHKIDMFAHCIELSDMTADLCYINLSAAGIAAQVIQGNSLSMVMGRCMPTPALCSDVWQYRFKYPCNTDEITDSVYITDGKNKSVDTGFKNMNDVLNIMGEPKLKCSERLFIYDGAAFTDYRIN